MRASVGDWVVDLDGGELRRGTRVIVLQEKPLVVLRVLVERAGTVVSREALRRALWPDGTYVDFDHALNTAVRKLRSALGDCASGPAYIETVARRGYRLIAPVETLGTRRNVRQTGNRTLQRLVAAAALAYAVAAPPPRALPPADAASDTRASAKIGGQELAAVRLLLEARREAALQDATGIAARLVTQHPANPAALAALAEAHALLGVLGYRDAATSLIPAKHFAERALRLAPNNAQAQRVLADVHLYVHRDPDAAELALRRSLEIAPRDWTTWSRYACLLHRTHRAGDALRAMARALALAPDSAIVHAEFGLYLHAVRRYDDELAHLERAVRLDPDSPAALFHFGLGLARRGAYQRSLEFLGRAARESGGETPYVAWLAIVSAQAGRRAAARDLLGQLTSPVNRRFVRPDLIGAINVALTRPS